MVAISTQLSEKLEVNIEGSLNALDHFRDQIILTDGEKETYDIGIANLDTELLSRIDDINNYLVGVQSAYEDRITVGCRTDVFWRVVGINTSAVSTTYDLTATKLSLSGYQVQPGGIGTVGMGTTGTVVATPTGITTASSLYGFEDDNLYGLKYYDEPYTRDIGDTSVATFIGTCSLGSTQLIIMLPSDDGVQEYFSAGQLVTCDKSGVFAAGSNTIAGLGTTTADLSKVSPGIGSTNATVPTITLGTNTLGVATAPQPDGTFVTFTVLDDPDEISSLSDYEIPFERNPFEPQQIGILTSISQIGIGRSIYLNNTGLPQGPQSWNPSNETSSIDDVDGSEASEAVVEPEIGADKIYYKVGFTNQPVVGGAPATEGQTVSAVSNLASYFTSLSACAAQDAAVSAAKTERDNAETAFTAGVSTFHDLLGTTRSLRDERDELSLQIWGLRQSIGKQIELVDKQRLLQGQLGITTIREVIDNG